MRLILIINYHYPILEDPFVQIKTAIPPTKVSPLYLQQQFFQYVKQQLVQMNTIRRTPSPNPINVQRPASNRPIPSQNKPFVATAGGQKIIPSSSTMTSTATSTANKIPQQFDSPEPSIDIFDSFEDYEAALYRLNVLKPFLSRLFESSPIPVNNPKKSSVLEGIEADLIAVTKKKINSLQERTEASHKIHQETIQRIKSDRLIFWSIFGELEGNGDLDQIYKKFMENEMKDMEQDGIAPVFTSL